MRDKPVCSYDWRKLSCKDNIEKGPKGREEDIKENFLEEATLHPKREMGQETYRRLMEWGSTPRQNSLWVRKYLPTPWPVIHDSHRAAGPHRLCQIHLPKGSDWRPRKVQEPGMGPEWSISFKPYGLTIGKGETISFRDEETTKGLLLNRVLLMSRSKSMETLPSFPSRWGKQNMWDRQTFHGPMNEFQLSTFLGL